MNGKGAESIRVILYSIGGILAGAILLLFLVVVVPRMLSGSTEQVMAKDMALSVMTVSASPYDVVLNYQRDTENYKVTVNQQEVRVSSKEGAGAYPYFQMNGVTVRDAVIEGTQSIPISLRKSVLSFEDSGKDFSDICASIPQSFDSSRGKMGVRFFVPETETGISRQYLDVLAATLNSRAKYESNSLIEYVAPNDAVRGADAFIILLRTSSGGAVKITYYEDPVNAAPTSWSHRMACYLQQAFVKNHASQFKEVQIAPSKDAGLTIDFGDPQNFAAQAKGDSTAALAGDLFSALNDALTD